jgi:hypothetical protein
LSAHRPAAGKQVSTAITGGTPTTRATRPGMPDRYREGTGVTSFPHHQRLLPLISRTRTRPARAPRETGRGAGKDAQNWLIRAP